MFKALVCCLFVCMFVVQTLHALQATNTSALHKREFYYGVDFFSGTFSRNVWASALLSNNSYYNETVRLKEWTHIYTHAIETRYSFKCYYNRDDNKLAFAFRGTDSGSDWMENFNALTTKTNINHPLINNEYVYCHKGIYEEYESYRSVIYNLMESMASYNPTLLITGHSQGGGLAQLAALDLAIKYNLPKSKIILITFAALAPGDANFATLGRNLLNHARIAAGWGGTLGVIYVDPVVDIMSFYGINSNHFGDMYIVESSSDITYNLHSMELSYIPGVRSHMFVSDLAAAYLPSTVKYIYQTISFQDLVTSNQCTFSLSLTSAYNIVYNVETLGGCSTPLTYLIFPTTLPTGWYSASVNAQYPQMYRMTVYPKFIWIDMSMYIPQQLTSNSTFQNCSSSSNCSCVNGYYGDSCIYRCSSKCASCNSDGTCRTCSNSNSVPPSCEPKCSSCVMGKCVENNVCQCNDGWTGTSCNELLCPVGCSSCTSQYQCSACKVGFYGLTCSTQCLPNCLSCSNSVSCTKCAPGYYGTTCTSIGYSSIRDVKIFPSTTGVSGAYASNWLYKVEKVGSALLTTIYGICDDGKKLVSYDTSTTAKITYFDTGIYSNYTFTDVSIDIGSVIFTTTTPGIVFVFGYSLSSLNRTATVPVPYDTKLNETIVSTRTDGSYSFYLTASGRLYLYGDASYLYQHGICVTSGNPTQSAFTTLTEITFPNNDRIKLFDCKVYICFAYSYSGKLYGWGKVSRSYYGINTDLCEYQPILLDTSPFTSEIISIEANTLMSMFLTQKGNVYWSGMDASLSIGNPSKPQELFPMNAADPFVRIKTYYAESIYTLSTRKGLLYVLGGGSYVTSLLGTTVAPTAKSTLVNVGYNGYLLHARYLVQQTTCFGVYDFDPTVCSGNGRCADTDACICKPEYAGANCNETVCFGVSSSDLRVCSGKGKCGRPNNCTCQVPFSGSNCELFNSNYCGNASTVPYQCQTCAIGSFNMTNLCRDKCLLNCESCNSSTSCQKCKSGFYGSDCLSYACQPNCMVCGRDACAVCKDGYFGPKCEFQCLSSCQTCENSQTCTSCKIGMHGSICDAPICLQNCLSCNDSSSCTSCMDGYRGQDCFTPCDSTCAACNATSCTKCKDGFYGNNCENKEARCDPTTSLSPSLSAREDGNGQVEYTVTLSKLFQNGNFTLRVALQNVKNCSTKGMTSTELQILSFNETACERTYTFKVAISSMISDPHVTKTLDSLGNVYTIKIPFYIAVEKSNVDSCQIVNYNINHEIKIVLSAHQYIEMSYETSNLTSASFTRDVISVTNKTLTIEGRLKLTNGALQSVEYLYSSPNHPVGFISLFEQINDGNYYLSLTANNTVTYYSGSFHFKLIVSISGNLYEMELVIDLQYFMPYEPPATNLALSTSIALYKDNFQQAATTFSVIDTTYALVRLVSASSVIPTTLGASVKNAYLCCMKDGMKMPTFDLSTGQLGCTVYDPANMTAWFRIYEDETPSSLIQTKTIKFPMVSFQVGFSFKLGLNALPFGSHRCYIHTESKMVLSASRSVRQDVSTFHSFDIIQFTNKEVIPQTSQIVAPKTSVGVNGGSTVGWNVVWMATVWMIWLML